MKIEIDQSLGDESDENGWRDLRLSASGKSHYELLLTAAVTAFDRDGEELFTSDLNDCDQETKEAVRAVIEAEFYKAVLNAAASLVERTADAIEPGKKNPQGIGLVVWRRGEAKRLRELAERIRNLDSLDTGIEEK